MKQKLILFISLLLAFASCGNPKVEQDALPQKTASFRTDVPLDSIILSDPCILADAKTRQYYMTGTGGLLWKSKDLALWEGPYRVADIDTTSWMGSRPQIWAAELHEYNGKYYYFATFTNNSIAIDTVGNNVIPRRASHVLVSDKAEGPYRPMADPTYLPADKPTLDGTFWVDRDGKPYMVYCHEWLQNNNGTIEKIELKSDLSGSIGEGKLLFRASDSPWTAPDAWACFGPAGYLMSIRKEWHIPKAARWMALGYKSLSLSLRRTSATACCSATSTDNGCFPRIVIGWTRKAVTSVCPIFSRLTCQGINWLSIRYRNYNHYVI